MTSGAGVAGDAPSDVTVRVVLMACDVDGWIVVSKGDLKLGLEDVEVTGNSSLEVGYTRLLVVVMKTGR